MGILDKYELGSPAPVPTGFSSIGGGLPGSGYNTVNEVRQAYDEGKLTYNAAYRILMDQFGMSDLDIQDILIIEPPQFDDNVPLDPGLSDAINNEIIPDTNPVTQESETVSIPMTDNQRFILIGAVVAFGLFGFIKK
tara:strand:+ start:1015 stop:1425 length:411 start_codon:yes stop_codon:yes gene_type:complete